MSLLQVYLDVTMFLGDWRSKQEKLESLLSIPDRVSEEGKSEGFSITPTFYHLFPKIKMTKEFSLQEE